MVGFIDVNIPNGTYSIILHVNFNWFKKNSLSIKSNTNKYQQCYISII